MSTKKITSPQQDDLTPGSFCKVKGFEKHLCKVVAIGTEDQMKEKLEEMERSEGMENLEDTQPPPKKKPRKISTRKGKVNKNPACPTKKKQGNILVVGSKMIRSSQQLTEIQTSTPTSHQTDLQKEVSFSSFSSVSVSPAKANSDAQESLKSGVGKYCTCTCRN